MTPPPEKKKGLYILLISLHGLIRGKNLELGRDLDTGGQIKYVIELMDSLSHETWIDNLVLLTRQVFDSHVSSDYAKPKEKFTEKAHVLRLPFGPRRYLKKEALWPYLDECVSQTLQYIHKTSKVPDLIHGHYADGGYVAQQLSRVLGVPFFQTAHSLGRVKESHLLEQGIKKESLEHQYKLSKRIEVEESFFKESDRIVASTKQEAKEQYQLYTQYDSKKIVVIPPGVQLKQFYPPPKGFQNSDLEMKLKRFLENPKKPMILAITRPDRKKNIRSLIKAYGKTKELKEKANLILLLGNRENIQNLNPNTRKVLQEILFLIDQYDLYGHVAYPPSHQRKDIPEIYRLATKQKGVFVNCALNEPFGLTLLESAASGLPVVTTRDGGPQEILKYCQHGVMINPLDETAIADALLEILSSRKKWEQYSKKAPILSKKHFSWEAHTKRYQKEVQLSLEKTKKKKNTWIQARRFCIFDVDYTLLGDEIALKQLVQKLLSYKNTVGFGLATGRSLKRTLSAVEEWNIPMPDLLITSVGSEIHYGPSLTQDFEWLNKISNPWYPKKIRQAMSEIEGITPQSQEGQGPYKISFLMNPETPKKNPSVRSVKGHLRKKEIEATVISSQQRYLDIIPSQSSKGKAIEFFSKKWGFALDSILVAGDSGNDEEMLTRNTLAVVVGNHSPELLKLQNKNSIYFASGHYAQGILEGIEHYQFLKRLETL